MKRTQWIATLLAVVLFGCGVLVGALGHRYYSTSSVNAGSSEDWRDRYMAEMNDRLRLTKSQQHQLNEILDQTRVKFRAVKERSQPEMARLKQEQKARIEGILTANQITEYQAATAEREKRAHEQDAREREEEKRRAAARQRLYQ